MHLLHRGLKERIKSGGWDSSEIGMKNGISWSPVHISWGRAWLWPISGKGTFNRQYFIYFSKIYVKYTITTYLLFKH
jgi:hypothetical protein